jgi:hypothetical protein
MAVEGIWLKIQNFINGVLDIVGDIYSAFGGSANFNLNLNIPDIPQIPMPSMPKFATGGYVTKPTAGIFGEAGPEAVVPLNKDMGLMDPVVEVLTFTNDILMELLYSQQQQGTPVLEIDGDQLVGTLQRRIRDREATTGRSFA